MRRLLVLLGVAAVLGLSIVGGCGKKPGASANPEIQQSIEKAATVEEIRKRGPQPPNPALRPQGVQAPGQPSLPATTGKKPSGQ